MQFRTDEQGFTGVWQDDDDISNPFLDPIAVLKNPLERAAFDKFIEAFDMSCGEDLGPHGIHVDGEALTVHAICGLGGEVVLSVVDGIGRQRAMINTAVLI